MESDELDSILSAILLCILIPDNSVDSARSTLQVLSKVVTNALNNSDPKYKRLHAANEKIKERIVQVPGATEFLDAIGFNRQDGGNGDFILSDTSRLPAANKAINEAIAALPPAAPSTSNAPLPSKATMSTSKPENNSEYEQRKREAEARQAEIQRKMEEDRKKKEALRAQIKAEQKEVRDRPVVASHAVSIQRSEPSAIAGDGKIRYTNSDRDFQSVISSKPAVIANFTASWCGPCQQIAPMVEEMARRNPGITFIKIDIDENQETPGKFRVSAVPTFILFKNGQVVDEVKGANPQGIQSLIAKV